MDQKKTDYGNWVPLALMKRLAAIAGALLAGEVLLIVLDGPTALTLLVGGLLAACTCFAAAFCSTSTGAVSWDRSTSI